jgi:hypothetical protein
MWVILSSGLWVEGVFRYGKKLAERKQRERRIVARCTVFGRGMPRRNIGGPGMPRRNIGGPGMPRRKTSSRNNYRNPSK